MLFFEERAFLARVRSATPGQLAEILAHATPEEERALREFFGEQSYRFMAGIAAQQRGGGGGVRYPLFDEHAFLRAVGAANTEELAELLRQPSADEERVLRIHLGDDRFQRMHALALGRSTRAAGRTHGNVVVIPGLMGSELTAFDRRGSGDPVWLSILRIIAGRMERLRLADDGLAGFDPRYDVRASGILKRYYGELLLSLSRSWTVRAFWFDWRKDISLAADELASKITAWFGADASIHIVAHSMGGLVARAFIANSPDRWKRMRDRGDGGRLIMLGTPNYGSYLIPQAITGVASTVRKLSRLDFWHSFEDFLKIVNSFVGTYQLLPSPYAPGVDNDLIDRLYQSATYGRLDVPQRYLDNARGFHQRLAGQVNPDRMAYIAGCNRPTAVGIADISQLGTLDGYAFDNERGDGSVPHSLGLLEDVDTYYVDEEHGDLPGNADVLAALDELLQTGVASDLSRTRPPRRAGGFRGAGEEVDPRTQIEAERRWREGQLEDLARRLKTRSAAPEASEYVSPQEREAEEVLMRDFTAPRGARAGRREVVVAAESASLEVGLVRAGIEAIDELDLRQLGGIPVDAVAVGHYLGVTPTNAEGALDRSITRALLGLPKDAPVEDRKLLLTQYTERGTLRGELAQLFFLADPRVRPGAVGGGRVIAIAGMGLPGRFGVSELVVLARELCWALGRQGKQHLATVLIGSGTGGLPVREGIVAWMRGVAQALSGAAEEGGRRLKRLTFVELDPRRILDIDNAIWDCQQRPTTDHALEIRYHRVPREEHESLLRQSEDVQREEWHRYWERQVRGLVKPQEKNPARITLSLDRQTYRFGAVTDTAAIPEREIPLDPALVMRANDELAAEWKLEQQYERGRFLEKLLVPADLRTQLSTDVPLVLLLDATTARIHWEMVAQTDPSSSAVGTPGDGGGPDLGRLFLGTARGLTRQLRTTFAPPPEPPPPPRRILRVLVVADPAEDARLPGAEQEGVEVADLFEAFGRAVEERRLKDPDNPLYQNGVEVVRLLGPRQATRTNVLRELVLRPYDVLHYAGHCMYDPQHPSSSGWIFSHGDRLSVNELRRIDHIPKFVFSNACESGITPDRAELRTPELAPSFAEAFFERGVADFVCTAWPVDDAAARQFALMLYRSLLGLGPPPKAAAAGPPVAASPPGRARLAAEETGEADRGGFTVYRLTGEVMPMHRAMREARLAIGRTFGGGRTWGAYQHYGSPNFRLFDHNAWPAEAPPARQGLAPVWTQRVVAQEAAPARRRPEARWTG